VKAFFTYLFEIYGYSKSVPRIQDKFNHAEVVGIKPPTTQLCVMLNDRIQGRSLYNKAMNDDGI
jgi:hypothetical protein